MNQPRVEQEWMDDLGFCGTCAYFHREPRCQGGICGFYSDTPQVEIGFGCEEYNIDKEWVMHFAIQDKI